ncbi:MAG: prolyl oligopeptidase family serine peptidase [Saprospiraceae bacterium]|jgi:dipeptidyl aminopeptidase/acylaminoacyl peptidase|nr:prolyl oligopeptidase family serine peptidase [Saprospiraceae bacterium]
MLKISLYMSFMPRVLILFLLALSQLPALAQGSFSIEAVMSAPFPTDLVAAPVGDQVAWVYNVEGERNIWLAEGPDFTGRQLTAWKGDDGQEITSLSFSPDGKKIVYVRGAAPNRRGEIPNPDLIPDGAKQEIWLLTIADGKSSRLDAGREPVFSPDGKRLAYVKGGQVWVREMIGEQSSRQAFTIRGSAGSLRWSPLSTQLAFVSSRGDHAFVGVYDFDSSALRYLNPSVDKDNHPAWSPDGRSIAFLRFPNRRSNLPFEPRREGYPFSLWVADARSGSAQEIWRANTGRGSVFKEIAAANQIFWGAGNRIVFPWEGAGWTQLYSVAAKPGAVPVNLSPGEHEVQYVHLSPDGKNMYYSCNRDDIDRQHIWKASLDGSSISQVTRGKGIEWLPVVTAGSGQVTFLAATGTHPAYAAMLKNNAPAALAPDAMPADFPLGKLVEPEQVIFSAADGMRIHGQLFLPKNRKAGQKYPALLFFHGGSRRQMLLGFHHRSYYHHSYAMNQWLADQGYVVLSVNYRSGIGYGMEFREALNYGATGASEFNDVLGAGLYLKNRPDVDPGKIGLWGGSYGGYLTAMGLAKAPDLFAAGVDIHGVHDWNVVIKNFVPDYNPEARPDFAKLAFDASPLAYIKDWRAPVLLIHGDDDRNVPFSETVDLAESLRAQGVEFEQLIFPDEVHSFLLHRNWVAAFRASLDFFNRKLQP